MRIQDIPILFIISCFSCILCIDLMVYFYIRYVKSFRSVIVLVMWVWIQVHVSIKDIACRSWEYIHTRTDFLKKKRFWKMLMGQIQSYKQCNVYNDIHIDVCFEIMGVYTHIGDHLWSSYWVSNKQHYLSHTWMDFSKMLMGKLEKKPAKMAKMWPCVGWWPLWPATWVGHELGGSAPH